jgi:Tfp pilus assembly protein PilN
LYVIVAAMALASACIAVQSSRHASAKLQRRADAANREWNDAARQVRQVLDLGQTQQALARHAELAATLLEKSPRSSVLADVANALPAGCWLLDIRLDSVNADGDALNVRLSGVAPGDAEIGQYVARLRQCKLLQNVKLAASDSATEQGARRRQFRISLCVGDTGAQAPPAAQPTMTASIGH